MPGRIPIVFIFNASLPISVNFTLGDDTHFYNAVYQNIQSTQLLGPELVLGQIFDEIGFSAIKNELFRHLVLTRLCYSVSKLNTVDY